MEISGHIGLKGHSDADVLLHAVMDALLGAAWPTMYGELGATVSQVGLIYIIISAGTETLTLNVYNWGEYISDGSEGTYDSNAEFEKYYEKLHYEKYGEKVNRCSCFTQKVVNVTYKQNNSPRILP